jgi:MFS family permease
MTGNVRVYDSSLTLLCAAKAVRTFVLSGVAVILACFLMERGFDAAMAGVILSATMIEDAVVTTLVAAWTPRLGAFRVLSYACMVIAVCGGLLAFCQDQWIIVLAVVFGILSPQGYEGGPFAAIEQTIIARGRGGEGMAHALSYYNLAGFAGAALGALATGLATTWLHAHNFNSYQAVYFCYGLSGFILLAIYKVFDSKSAAGAVHTLGGLSVNRDSEPLYRAHRLRVGEVRPHQRARFVHSEPGATRKIIVDAKIWRFSFLQGLDAFGGGFVAQTLISYWFYTRYHVGAETLGAIFFWANVFAAVSFFAAPVFVRRFGLLNTMVFTHLPCSLALCLIPLMPSFALSAAILLLRSFFSSMDIPVRQAYTMLLVPESERPTAAAVTNAFRSVTPGLAPVISGVLFSNPLLGLPFICGGICKSVYDLGLLFSFRTVPLHDERQRFAGAKLESSGVMEDETRTAIAANRQFACLEYILRRRHMWWRYVWLNRPNG